MKPTFLRMVGAHRANDFSFGLGQCRRDIPEGTFGFTGVNWCDDCKAGFDEELGYKVTHRQTWEQPEEGYNYCPHCGSEDCGENEQDHDLKVTKRYSIHRNPNYRKSA